jgi:DedD protein
MHARDPAELYKDKIEVSLDGRQIFYLFFGGAVVVGMVFVLGVIVGRRVEARGHVAMRTAASADPLAALDRLEGPAGGLSFKGTLMGTQAPTEVERTIDELEKAGVVKPAPGAVIPPKVEKKAEPKVEKAEKAEKAAPKAEKAEPKPEKAEKAEKAELKAEKAELKPEKAEKAEKAEPKVEKAEPKPEKAEKLDKKDRELRDREKERDRDRDGKDRDKDKDRDAKKKKRADNDAADAGSSRFTLQLSAFQDRQEADTFMSTLKAAGFQAYLSEADVGSKGTFYRVRIGSYRTADAAHGAKAELERVTKKNASVMRL